MYLSTYKNGIRSYARYANTTMGPFYGIHVSAVL